MKDKIISSTFDPISGRTSFLLGEARASKEIIKKFIYLLQLIFCSFSIISFFSFDFISFWFSVYLGIFISWGGEERRETVTRNHFLTPILIFWSRSRRFPCPLQFRHSNPWSFQLFSKKCSLGWSCKMSWAVMWSKTKTKTSKKY